MRFADGAEFPGAIFTVNFGKGHGAHTVVGGIARETELGYLLAVVIHRADKALSTIPKCWLFLRPW
jgi:hypothetical protein